MFLRFLVLFLIFSAGLAAKSHILVSIEPLKFLVEEIGGDKVSTLVLVPPGASPHSFEPTAKQLILASQADLWFCARESFEEKALKVLKSHHPSIKVIDTLESLPLIKGHLCHHCKEDIDTHVWLSPTLYLMQAQIVYQALCQNYPEHSLYFLEKFNVLKNKLESLNQELSDLFSKARQKYVLVSHPAFAYFCRDYHLTQLSIEVEGRDPGAKQLTHLLQQLRSYGIKVVFAQEQYQTKGAYLIAKELGGKVIMVDPYSSNYIQNLKQIAYLFAGQP